MKNINQLTNEGLNLLVDDSLTTNDIVALDRNDVPVVRTPHVGNFSTALATVALGLNHLVADRMMTGRDTIYHPTEVIVGGESVSIAPSAHNASVSHTTIDTVPAALSDLAQPGDPLQTLHSNAMQKVFPNNQRLELQTDNMLRRGEVIHQVVQALSEETLGSFNRYLQADGRVRDVSPTEARQLLETQGFLTDGTTRGETEGLLLPNKLAILLDGVANSLEYQADIVYALCGQVMAGYIKHRDYADMPRLYQLIRERTGFGNKLPKQLDMIFVPTMNTRFVVPSRQRGQIDALFDGYLAYQAEESARGKARGQVMAELPRDQANVAVKALSQEHRNLKLADQRQLGRLALELPGIFAPVESRNQVTQYDLLLDGGYYLAPQLLNVPMQGLAKIFKELTTFRNQEAKL